MHRIKLNDRMTFPEELDMSPFIDVEDEVSATMDSRVHQVYIRLICHQNFVAFVYFDNLQISQWLRAIRWKKENGPHISFLFFYGQS